MVKERVVNIKCIFMSFFGIFLSFFGDLSEIFWSKFVRAAISIIILPFCFATLNLSIYQSVYLSIYQAINQSIYVPTSNLPTNLFIWSYLSKFFKEIFISWNSTVHQNRLSWKSNSSKDFIRSLLGFVDMYCHQKLLS